VFGRRKQIPVDAGRSPEAAGYLATEIERLIALPLASQVDTEHWYSECGKVQRVLITRFPEFEFYHEVWHFFADADTRARDERYRDRQHSLMFDYIALLRDDASKT
jgi:hypothetical protein